MAKTKAQKTENPTNATTVERTRTRREFTGLDDVIGKFPPAMSFHERGVGSEFTMELKGAQSIAERNYETKKVQYWEDGRLRKILVLSGPTRGCGAEGEDRSFFVRGRKAKEAFREAMEAARVDAPAPGDILTVKLSDLVPVLDEYDQPVSDENGEWQEYCYEMTLEV